MNCLAANCRGIKISISLFFEASIGVLNYFNPICCAEIGIRSTYKFQSLLAVFNIKKKRDHVFQLAPLF